MKKRIRTQIYLDAQQVQWLKLEATHRRTTMSGLVRDAIGHIAERERRRVDWANDPITKLLREIESGKWAGSGKTGPHDGAVEHDHYIYGVPKLKDRER